MCFLSCVFINIKHNDELTKASHRGVLAWLRRRFSFKAGRSDFVSILNGDNGAEENNQDHQPPPYAEQQRETEVLPQILEGEHHAPSEQEPAPGHEMA